MTICLGTSTLSGMMKQLTKSTEGDWHVNQETLVSSTVPGDGGGIPRGQSLQVPHGHDGDLYHRDGLSHGVRLQGHHGASRREQGLEVGSIDTAE